MSSLVRPMVKRDAAGVALLHKEGIHTGFLSNLGVRFLRQLYAAIPSCPSGFGLVWEGPAGRVLGFIACAESTGRVYKQAMLRRGLLMMLSIIRYLFRPSVIRRLMETWRYPAEVGPDLPPAEVLSIVVSQEMKGKGIGRALIETAAKEFSRRNIRRIKVAVGADNEGGNAFYRRCGFELALTREHHGRSMNVYVLDLTA